MFPIEVIVAVDAKDGISKNNVIPWQIKEDSDFFSDVTKSGNKKNVVIMGRKTWKSLPEGNRGLKDRINIVVSNKMKLEEFHADNTTMTESYLVPSFVRGLNFCNGRDDVGKIFIIGGSGLYQEAFSKCLLSRIHLTRIEADCQCDIQFPSVGLKMHREVSNKSFQVKDLKSNKEVKVSFITYAHHPEIKDEQTQFERIVKQQEKPELQYLNLLESTLKTGHFRETRNAQTWSIFGETLKFDLAQGFPLLTTKKIFFRGIVEELAFFLRGDTNTKHLSDKGIKIWEANTSQQFLKSVNLPYEEFDMGPMYGFNWLHFGAKYSGMNDYYANKGFNQINYCLNLLKKDPFSRRIIMTTFNPAQAKEGVLYPCHSLINQFYVSPSGDRYLLSSTCYNRSQDAILGLPFNLAMSALLVHLFCEVINNDPGYKGPKFFPGKLILNLGDVHIYEDHYSEAVRQILREPYPFPQLNFKRPVTDLTKISFDDLDLVNYQCYPALNVKMVA